MSPVDSCGRRALRGDRGAGGLRSVAALQGPLCQCLSQPLCSGCLGKGAAPLRIGSKMGSAVLLPVNSQRADPFSKAYGATGLWIEAGISQKKGVKIVLKSYLSNQSLSTAFL